MYATAFAQTPFRKNLSRQGKKPYPSSAKELSPSSSRHYPHCVTHEATVALALELHLERENPRL